MFRGDLLSISHSDMDEYHALARERQIRDTEARLLGQVPWTVTYSRMDTGNAASGAVHWYGA